MLKAWVEVLVQDTMFLFKFYLFLVFLTVADLYLGVHLIWENLTKSDIDLLAQNYEYDIIFE